MISGVKFLNNLRSSIIKIISTAKNQTSANPPGQMLLVLVITMTSLAVWGAGMLYVGTTSSFTELFANNREKAHFLAKAGIAYASQQINMGTYYLGSQVFTLSDGNQFSLSICDYSTNPTLCPVSYYIYVESTGIVNQNSGLETKQKITARFTFIPFGKREFQNKGLYAKTNITLGNNAQVFGDLGTNATSSGIVSLGNNAQVQGNVVVGPGGDSSAVHLGNNAHISGTITDAVSIAPMPPVPAPTGGTTIPPINDTQTLFAGTYRTSSANMANNGRLTITGSVTLIVTGNFNMGNNARIIISSSPSSSLTLYVAGNITFGNNNQIIQAAPASAPALLILNTASTTKNITAGNNTNIYAGIYAPKANIHLNNNAKVHGAAIGSTTTAGNNAKIYYDSALISSFGGGGSVVTY